MIQINQIQVNRRSVSFSFSFIFNHISFHIRSKSVLPLRQRITTPCVQLRTYLPHHMYRSSPACAPARGQYFSTSVTTSLPPPCSQSASPHFRPGQHARTVTTYLTGKTSLCLLHTSPARHICPPSDSTRTSPPFFRFPSSDFHESHPTPCPESLPPNSATAFPPAPSSSPAAPNQPLRSRHTTLPVVSADRILPTFQNRRVTTYP